MRGTDAYVPPEFAYNKQYNKSSDIWSLGCILYELAARRRTFEGGLLSDVWESFRKKGVTDPLGFRTFEDGTYFEPFVLNMLQIESMKRPQVMELLETFSAVRTKLNANRYL